MDVGDLGVCFEGIAKGKAGEEILDKWAEIRRGMWVDYIDPFSSSNFLRVSSANPDTAAEEDEFMSLLKKAEHDPEIKKQIDQVSSAILVLVSS